MLQPNFRGSTNYGQAFVNANIENWGTNDLQDYLASFFGRPWTDEDRYRRHSPIRHVANVTSPMLILHGSADTRVPVEQSVEFYQALKDLGKEVTFVRYPREGHGFTEPRHLMNRLRRYAEFFGEHVNNPPISERVADTGTETGGEDEPIR